MYPGLRHIQLSLWSNYLSVAIHVENYVGVDMRYFVLELRARSGVDAIRSIVDTNVQLRFYINVTASSEVSSTK